MSKTTTCTQAGRERLDMWGKDPLGLWPNRLPQECHYERTVEGSDRIIQHLNEQHTDVIACTFFCSVCHNSLHARGDIYEYRRAANTAGWLGWTGLHFVMFCPDHLAHYRDALNHERRSKGLWLI